MRDFCVIIPTEGSATVIGPLTEADADAIVRELQERGSLQMIHKKVMVSRDVFRSTIDGLVLALTELRRKARDGDGVR